MRRREAVRRSYAAVHARLDLLEAHVVARLVEIDRRLGGMTRRLDVLLEELDDEDEELER